ncbi:MAG TPA: hypothetical protein VN643_02510 [Pyrinomonadaceae bacterium]|nr:hypothetical protein [Pyrinomonadaceae bacterium]
MFFEKLYGKRSLRTYFASLSLSILAVIAVGSSAIASPRNVEDRTNKQAVKVEAPVNIAILIQDDLISAVGNEIRITADFIRTLPQGSRVMVGYITSGSLQVRSPFTSDLNAAAQSLRIPYSSTAASPYNPYVEVIEAIRKFDTSKGRNVILLISDGLDVSRGFDTTSAADTMDLLRAIKEANARQIAIYSFYAPSVGLTSHNRLAASYGQSSLNRISNETGGRAFFQGTTGFVTFDPYFNQLRRVLNERS